MPQIDITVLIADDEASIRNGLKELVLSEDFHVSEVSVADNGYDTLSYILEKKPDIAIIDINMPQMNGLEVIQQVRKNQLATRFIIISGYNDFSYAQLAIRYHADSYFLKPINLNEFKEFFRDICQEILAKRKDSDCQNNDSLQVLIDTSRIYFLNQLIGNMIHTSDVVNRQLSILNLSITNSSCIVVVFTLKHESIDSNKLSKILNHINISLRMYPCESWIYSEHNIISIVNDASFNYDSFYATLTECIQTINQNGLGAIYASIGNRVSSLLQCAASYGSAQEAYTYHIYHENRLIFDTTMISREIHPFSKKDVNIQPLISFIIRHDLTGIQNYCENFFNSLFFVPTPSPNYLLTTCIYLVMSVQKQIELLYPHRKFGFTYDEISSFDSVSDIYKWIYNFFIRYSKTIRDDEAENTSIIQSAKEYIENNLSCNIKANDVARHINVSESYFSLYFKENTGVNFRDYVLVRRIEYAKKLLRQQNKSITEIADLTGYQDYRSFSRAFKGETGLSPSEYLAKIRK